MRDCLAIVAVSLWFAGPTWSQECPANATDPLWNRAACDFSFDVDLAATISDVNARMPGFDEQARQFMIVMVAGNASVFDLNDGPKIWLFKTTEILTMGEMKGAIGPYLPRNDEEDSAEAALVRALSRGDAPELAEVLGFAQLMVENRGGKLLLGIGPPGAVFPMVVTSEVYCRWENVAFPGFYLLGTIDQLENDGTTNGVNWEAEPKSCNGGES